MKKSLIASLLCVGMIASCATFHPITAEYQDEGRALAIVAKTMTMTPIVEIDRTGGVVTGGTITVLEAPDNHMWAMLTVTVDSKSSGTMGLDFNEITLITASGKRMIPYLAKKVNNTSAVLSKSYGGPEVPFMWEIKYGPHDYCLYFDVNLDDVPVSIKIDGAAPSDLGIPPEEFSKKPLIIAS